MTLVDLPDARDPALCGGKAAPLARLLGAGLPVPPGFVVPTTVHRDALAGARATGAAPDLPDAAVAALTEALDLLARRSGTPYVAVRSSAVDEDGEHASAAGQHATALAVRGADEVRRAVLTCWASVQGERATAYRRATAGTAGSDGTPPPTAVLVQALVDADVAGVLFTGPTTVVEASRGLGEPVVAGRVTPDRWVVRDGAVVGRTAGRAAARTDRDGGRLVVRDVPPALRDAPCLGDEEVLALSALGHVAARVLGRAALDVEWAVAGGRAVLLQARPVTAPVPLVPGDGAAGRPAGTAVLTGAPGASGVARGPVRVVRGPADFAAVRPGDVLVCRDTDPAWTPLFTVAGAVVTQTGGLLSHAAIVAREVGIPAVLGVDDAVGRLAGAGEVVVDGDRGTVAVTRPA